NLASQIIGYTGAIPSRAMWLNLQAKGYSYNDTIGRDGIESSMEDWLTQNSSLRKGYRIVERDQMSRVVRELDTMDPKDGNNVKLTLNAAYQQEAERCIKENVRQVRDNQEKILAKESWLEANKNDIHNRDWVKYPLALAEHGCLVVLDMQCRVLALANYPTYDLNALVAGGKDAMAILGDARNLLLNYGIHARGTPGSIFKMVTGMGALSEGKLLLDERISDMGYYTRYNQDLSTAPKCWIGKNYRWKHANQTIVEGLTNSCNYFFYELSSRLGEERLYRYASLFGLTSKTGIDLPGEVRSVVWLHEDFETACRIRELMRVKDAALALIPGTDWDADLSPWPAPGVFGGSSGFSGGAGKHLETLARDWIPETESALSEAGRPLVRVIAGYSLAGLFALWAAAGSDLFDASAAVSGSFWYDGFAEWFRGREISAKFVYLSVGDKEKNARNPRMAKVEEAGEAILAGLKEKGIPAVFEKNPGGHFRDVPERMARGIDCTLSALYGN
ncbi:MAG: hypothetical protein II680_13135, partial [Clostridia bacterium]|nr:hypothetical protein [Clostridia bacterium]